MASLQRLALNMPVLIALTLALAGCASSTSSSGAGDGSSAAASVASTGTLSSASFSPGVQDFARSHTPGEVFTFKVSVGGDPSSPASRNSDHIGAHFWATAAPTDPDAQLSQATACNHVSGALPGGPYTIQCTAPTAAGTYHLMAHARVSEADKTWNWWGSDVTFTVA